MKISVEEGIIKKIKSELQMVCETITEIESQKLSGEEKLKSIQAETEKLK